MVAKSGSKFADQQNVYNDLGKGVLDNAFQGEAKTKYLIISNSYLSEFLCLGCGMFILTKSATKGWAPIHGLAVAHWTHTHIYIYIYIYIYIL